MPNFKRIVARLTGNIYIPEEAKELNGKTLLHISDTPAMIFSNLHKLIQALKPNYIVHTGDMVDNIKLEIYPTRHYNYKKHMHKLHKILEIESGAEVRIVTGNHDDYTLVQSLFTRSKVYAQQEELNIEGHRFLVSHYSPSQVNNNVEYVLFGHDIKIQSHVEDATTYLNGIDNIYLIEIESGVIVPIEYPTGTNDSRLNKHRIGI